MQKDVFSILLKFATTLLLFLLPWQTILIIHEYMVNGAKWQYGTVGWYGVEVLLWIAALLFMVWFWRNIKYPINIQKNFLSPDRLFAAAVLLFIIYTFLSSLWSPYPDIAIQHARWVLEVWLFFFILYLGPLKYQEIIWWFALGSIVPYLLGLWQFLIQSSVSSTLFGLSLHPVWEAGTSIISSSDIGRWLRAYGSFSHPNIFGGYSVIVLIGIVTLLLTHADSVTKTKRVVLLGISILASAALFFTFSRSAWIAMAIFLFLYFFISKNNWKTFFLTLWPFCLTVLILSFVFFPLVQTRFAGESVQEVRSITERMSGNQEALDIIKKHPLVGVGIGNYTGYVITQTPHLPGWAYQPVHNTALLFIAELGITGAILFLCILLLFLHLLRSISNKLFQGIYFMLCIAPLLLLDHYLLTSFTGILLLAMFFVIVARKQ